MADENTTDSTSTTTSETAPPAADSSNTSTTATPEAPPADAAPAADGPPQPAAGTILTPEAETDGANSDAEPQLSEEEQAAADARAALFGVPEGDYDLSGALPEGTVIDTAALDAVVPVARELGLSNEGLGKIAGVYAEKVLPQVTQAVTDQIMSNSAAAIAQWATDATEAVKTDPAFGGKPMAEVQAISAKALDRFGGSEFRQYLQDTGLGNHPAMVKAMFLAGSAIAEDTTFERGDAPTRQPTREEKFYGKTT